MLFNSIDFAIFLPVVFVLYWYVFGRNHRAQNTLMLLASCWFYMAFVPVYILILAVTIGIDYVSGILIEDSKGPVRKRWLTASIIANLGVLGAFKYWNFLNENIGALFTSAGFDYNLPDLGMLLPIGLSFHTFQSLAYTIEVYRGTQQAERRPGMFALYVMFFPQLVAGPIERPRNLLQQIEHPRTFDRAKAVDGLRQMLWGLFKKIVIADNCAAYANPIFEDPTGHTGSTLLVGALLFTFQIYCDFSGYSDIAIGCSRLFGFSLMRNFAFPYFSRDIAEFWRRWHISLSTWFRDYVYIPLGGSRGGKWSSLRNTLIIFLLSGLWHGANWTFLCWGALNALYFIPLLLAKRNRRNLDTVAAGRWLPTWREFFGMAATFFLAVLAWIFFRAENVTMALQHLQGIFTPSLFSLPTVLPKDVLLLVFGFVLVEWVSRERQHPLEIVATWRSRGARWVTYYAFIVAIITIGGQEQEFIYFQF